MAENNGNIGCDNTACNAARAAGRAADELPSSIGAPCQASKPAGPGHAPAITIQIRRPTPLFSTASAECQSCKIATDRLCLHINRTAKSVSIKANK
jgi:hypothetical protein